MGGAVEVHPDWTVFRDRNLAIRIRPQKHPFGRCGRPMGEELLGKQSAVIGARLLYRMIGPGTPSGNPAKAPC